MRPGQMVPAMAPFGCGQRYNITGLIHDETGFPTNSHEEAGKLMYRLMHKISDNYAKIVQSESLETEDADTVIVCYGGTMRAVEEAMREARAGGKKVGIFRPVTIWPFPERELEALSAHVKRIVVAEHNLGQIVLEVERIVKGACPVDFIGKADGTVITPAEILNKLEEVE
jgi:2-oxoglutarate ferredoxin oxidoreductase subunit alpha